jgi:hypothetical protein
MWIHPLLFLQHSLPRQEVIRYDKTVVLASSMPVDSTNMARKRLFHNDEKQLTVRQTTTRQSKQRTYLAMHNLAFQTDLHDHPDVHQILKKGHLLHLVRLARVDVH